MGKNSKNKAIRKETREKVFSGEIKPPQIKHKQKDPNDLFDNPYVAAAMAALSDKDKEKYKMIGEQLYGNVDFENSKILGDQPLEAHAYIESQLLAGLHPSLLEDNEKLLIEELYGKKWYEKWGYVEADLTDIVTLSRNISP